jgi:hypothetical protein
MKTRMRLLICLRLPAAAYGKRYGSGKSSGPGLFFRCSGVRQMVRDHPGCYSHPLDSQFFFVRDEVRDAGDRSVRATKMNDGVDEQGRQEEEVHDEAGEAEAHGHEYRTEECVQQQPRRRQ